MVGSLFNGVYPLSCLRNDVDRLFDRMTDGFPRTQAGWGSLAAFPAVNLWEDEKNMYVEAELPGVMMKDIEVSVMGDELSLKGERKDGAGEGSTYHRRERGIGTFARVFRLPVEIDAEKVEATMRNGVLLITLPKAAAARPRKVAVKELMK